MGCDVDAEYTMKYTLSTQHSYIQYSLAPMRKDVRIDFLSPIKCKNFNRKIKKRVISSIYFWIATTMSERQKRSEKKRKKGR